MERWQEEHSNETKACLALKILGFCYANIVSSYDKRLAIRMPDYGGASTDTIQGLKREFARQIQGLPLVPMVSGDVKVIHSHGERPCFATARQRLLTPSIERRLVHPDAVQAVPELFEDPSFLQRIHIDTFSPSMLKEHIETQFPSQWKGCSVVSWTGEARVPSPSGDGGVPSPLWIFNFWKEISYAGSVAADLFRGWPLIPISTNELLSCSLRAAVLYVSEMQLEREKHDSLLQQNVEATRLPSEEATEDVGRQKILPSQDPSSSSLSSLENSSSGIQDAGHASLPVLPRQEIYGILKTLGVPLVRACFVGGAAGSVEPISDSQLPIRIIESLTILTSMTKDTVALVPRPSSSHKCSYQVVQDSWLKWERLSTDDRGKMLSFLDSQMSVVVGGDYSLAEKKMVAQLPLFRTLGGRFVSIYGRDYYILEIGVDPHGLLLPADAQSLVLERTDETPVDLIKSLGVTELTVGAALQRFTLPTFHSISTENQDSLRSFLVEKWPSLRKSSSLVDALRKMPVAVNGCGDAVCASELLDPQNSLLTDIFADEPHKFPGQAYQSSEASLLFLNDMGLQRHIGPALFVECAAKVQSTGEAEQQLLRVNGQGRPSRENMARSLLPCSASISTVASRLLDYFMEHFHSLYSSKLCSSLAPLFFLPVPEVKVDAETMIRGGTAVVHLERYESALEEKASESSAKTKMCLARFCDVVIWNDRHLAWTVKSILQDRFVPPQVSWKNLGIESPPALSVVTRHVTHLSNFVVAEVEMHEHGISATLGRMNKADFVNIFRHLEKESHHHGVDGNMFFGIEHLPCVPIGEALVRPQQIYRRLENSLPPLMYRVPEGMEELRCVCFKSLPSLRDYVESVRQLKRTVGNKPLNPQEIAVVLRMAHLLTETIATAATSASSTTTTTTTTTSTVTAKPGDAPLRRNVDHVDNLEKEFLIPDKMGCLVPVGFCVLDDDPSLTSRIFDPHQEHPHSTTPVEKGMSLSLRVAHPKLPRAVAEKLGIPRVSTIMEERLTTDFEDFEPMSMTRTFSNVHDSHEIIREEQRLNALLQSVDFAKAIISISNRDSAEDSISSSVHRAHHAPTLLDYDHRVYELHQLLQAWHVCFVDTLVTQFVPNEKLLQDNVVHIQSIQSSASWFLRHAGKQILVSLASMEGRHKSDDTSSFDVFDKGSRASSGLYVLHSLAVAIGMLIQGIVPLKQPLVLTAALSCEKSSLISDMLHRLKVTLSEESISEMVRGTPGQLVTPADKACLKISPLHYFTRGEIVAFIDKTHEGAGSLRYGVVKNVISNSIVKNEPGGDHSPRSESPSLCNDSSSVIEVQVSSEMTKLFPRTSVYIFTQTRTSGDHNELHDGGQPSAPSSLGNATSSSSISEPVSTAASASREKQQVYGMVETKISDQNRTTSQEKADGVHLDGSELSLTTTKEDEVFEAVNELLSSLHLKVSPDVISLAKENARLRQEHERSEQMQSAMRKQLSRYAEFVDRLEAGMICPITQEVIQYPGVASDGHTYEGGSPSMVSICNM
jgi:hypothetical protein